MNKPIGGRGKKAPYATTHIRIPVPIKEQVENLINDYRLMVIDGIMPSDDTGISLEDAKELSKKLLKSRTKNIESHAKLLTAIYGQAVTVEDLQS